MKTTRSLTALIWICNLAMVAVIATFGIVISFMLTVDDTTSESTEGLSSLTISHTVLNHRFVFNKIYEPDQKTYKERYYYIPNYISYNFSYTAAPVIEVQKRNDELSESRFLGVQKLNVYSDPQEAPIMQARIGIPLTDMEYLTNLRLVYIFSLMSILLAGVIIWLLRSLLIGLRTPDFFTPKNTRILTLISLLILSFPLIKYGWFKYIQAGLDTRLSADGASLTESFLFNYELFFAGLIVAAVAWVFHKAVKLQQEQELTI